MNERIDIIFRLLEEGAPTDVIAGRIEDLRPDERQRLIAHMKTYRDNIIEDAQIPEDIVESMPF